MATKKTSKTPVKKFVSQMDSTIKAYEDLDFLRSPACRGIRLELEYLKPTLAMNERQIKSTIVVFGSARIKPPSEADKIVHKAVEDLAKAPDSAVCKKAFKEAQHIKAMSKYYAMAQEFAQLVTNYDKDASDGYQFVIITGGGGGIMEAGNRGANDCGGLTVGLNITLPFEQKANKYISDGLSFQFNYFSIRKMHFMIRAKALGCFPGGFGTMDELFEGITLIQTKIIPPMPVLLFGREYWEKIVNWQMFIDEGMISPDDLKLFTICDSAQEGWNEICKFYNIIP